MRLHQIRIAMLAIAIGFHAVALADSYALKSNPIYSKFGEAQMHSCEVGENLPLNQRPADYCGHPYVVPYFTKQAEREPYRVVITDGEVHRATVPHDLYPDGDWFFVMDDSGNFYFFDKSGDTPVHHSSFFSGAPIAAGGDLTVQDGKITALGYFTGHYLMTPTILRNAQAAFADDGVDVDSLDDLGGHN